MLWKWWTEHFWRTNLNHMKLASPVSFLLHIILQQITINFSVTKAIADQYPLSTNYWLDSLQQHTWQLGIDLFHQTIVRSFHSFVCYVFRSFQALNLGKDIKKFYTICVLCYDNSTDSIKSEAVDRGVCKKGVLKNFAKCTGKHL